MHTLPLPSQLSCSVTKFQYYLEKAVKRDTVVNGESEGYPVGYWPVVGMDPDAAGRSICELRIVVF